MRRVTSRLKERTCSTSSISLTLVRESSRDAPGVLHVPVHLLHERVDGVEALLAAQAVEELEPQLLPVDVAVEVEQVRLDEQPAPGLERRADADVDRGDVVIAADLG